ncbi:hypothetical protein BMJ22_16970 [Sinorhizobium medicae]|nr:hypothetical protein BMJ22_16970 [Sinorhizobium medicae]
MRIFMIAAVGLVLAGCTTTPDRYAAQLPHDDPKYNTAECKEIRLKALEFDNKVGSRMAIGLASPKNLEIKPPAKPKPGRTERA